MGNRKNINGGNAFSQFDVEIKGGNASTQLFDKIIIGGNAFDYLDSEWLKIRKEMRKIKRMFRHDIQSYYTYANSFMADFELISYDMNMEQWTPPQRYLKRTAKSMIKRN